MHTDSGQHLLDPSTKDEVLMEYQSDVNAVEAIRSGARRDEVRGVSLQWPVSNEDGEV